MSQDEVDSGMQKDHSRDHQPSLLNQGGNSADGLARNNGKEKSKIVRMEMPTRKNAGVKHERLKGRESND